MKTMIKLLIAAVLGSLLATLCFAQVSPSPEPGPSDFTIGLANTSMSTLAALLGGKYGMAAKVFSMLATLSGFCALTIKPFWDKFIFPGITAYVQSTATKDDDAWLAAALQNRWVKSALWLLNLLVHVKVPIIDKDGAAVSPSTAGTTLPSSP